MPHNSDARVKIVRPARKTRFRPARSPSRPASSSRLPKVTRNALTTQVRFAWLKWRSRWIDGSATFTIVTSSTIISWARQTMNSVTQRRRSEERETRDARFIQGSKCVGVDIWSKLEAASEITGGTLRNYTEDPSVCQAKVDEHYGSNHGADDHAAQARRRAAQLREGARGRARGL